MKLLKNLENCNINTCLKPKHEGVVYSSVSRYTELKKSGVYHCSFKTGPHPSEDHLVITLTKHLLRNQKVTLIFYFCQWWRNLFAASILKNTPHREQVFFQRKNSFTCQLTSQKISCERNILKPTCTLVHRHKHFIFNSIWRYLSLSTQNWNTLFLFHLFNLRLASFPLNRMLKTRNSNFSFFWRGVRGLHILPSDAKGELRSEAHISPRR